MRRLKRSDEVVDKSVAYLGVGDSKDFVASISIISSVDNLIVDLI